MSFRGNKIRIVSDENCAFMLISQRSFRGTLSSKGSNLCEEEPLWGSVHQDHQRTAISFFMKLHETHSEDSRVLTSGFFLSVII